MTPEPLKIQDVSSCMDSSCHKETIEKIKSAVEWFEENKYKVHVEDCKCKYEDVTLMLHDARCIKKTIDKAFEDVVE